MPAIFLINIFIWIACTQDIATKAINQIPEIQIQEPLTEGDLIEGTTILLEAQVTDSRRASSG